MPKLKRVEKQIWDLEGFAVTFRRRADLRDVRDDLEGLASYRFKERKAKRTMTVAGWKESRFHPHYGEYDVDVLMGDGNAAPGNMRLGKVRESYFEDAEIEEDSELEGDE